jgi:hypothetical protein
MFDDWKWKWGQPNPEPQMSDFQGAMPGTINPANTAAHAVTKASSPGRLGTIIATDFAGGAAYTPGQPTYDSAGYNTAYDRWRQLEDEDAKQQALWQEMALGTPSQTSAAQGGSVGKPTDLKTSIFDVSSGPKNTMATLEDFNVPDYPFLKRWRY